VRVQAKVRMALPNGITSNEADFCALILGLSVSS
jgi:hypothetical protein